MNPRKCAAVIGFCCFVAGCTGLETGDSAKEALLQRDRAWSVAAAEGRDVDRIVDHWSDDAVVIPSGAPVIRGKAAIRDYVRKSLAIPGFQIRWQPQDASLSADGTLGYTTGENAVTVPGPGGTLITIPGRYATVWRRDSSGAWKCVVDIWNSGP